LSRVERSAKLAVFTLRGNLWQLYLSVSGCTNSVRFSGFGDVPQLVGAMPTNPRFSSFVNRGRIVEDWAASLNALIKAVMEPCSINEYYSSEGCHLWLFLLPL